MAKMWDHAKKMCLFVPGKPCNIDVDEIPLEVCKLCLEAWKYYVSNVTVKHSAVKTVEEATVPVQTEKSKLEDLSELDRHFMNGELSVEEYLQRRKEAIISLQKAET